MASNGCQVKYRNRVLCDKKFRFVDQHQTASWQAGAAATLAALRIAIEAEMVLRTAVRGAGAMKACLQSQQRQQ